MLQRTLRQDRVSMGSSSAFARAPIPKRPRLTAAKRLATLRHCGLRPTVAALALRCRSNTSSQCVAGRSSHRIRVTARGRERASVARLTRRIHTIAGGRQGRTYHLGRWRIVCESYSDRGRPEALLGEAPPVSCGRCPDSAGEDSGSMSAVWGPLYSRCALKNWIACNGDVPDSEDVQRNPEERDDA